jgi:hypothetical protein
MALLNSAGRAFRDLLGDRRMRVAADSVRGFRVEGLFEWSLEMRNAQCPQDTGRLVSVVAGARSDRLHTGPPGIIVRMQFAS